MKYLAVILLCSVAFLCLVQAGAAITYEGQITTSPTVLNALKPGDQISEVSGMVDLPTSGDQTFNPDDTVDFYTQLDNAKWSVSIVVNGIANPARTFGGKHATIGGYDLAYPTTTYGQVKLQFTLNDGTVPSSFTSGNIILVRCLELDTNSNQVGSAFYVNGTVFNPQLQQANLTTMQGKLADLKSAIEAKSSMNVDITAAQAKYQEASNDLNQASTALISSPSTVQSYLDAASVSIGDANIALAQAWADRSLQQAKTMVNSVDGLITEFTVNDSMKESDPRLVPIINKRDLAAQDISNANDLYTTGNYDSARTKANDGLVLANQAWNLSLDLKTELSKGFQLPGLPNLSAFLPILVVVVVVLLIVGVIIYRKRTRWDELG
jgi:hypothetical protein